MKGQETKPWWIRAWRWVAGEDRRDVLLLNRRELIRCLDLLDNAEINVATLKYYGWQPKAEHDE